MSILFRKMHMWCWSLLSKGRDLFLVRHENNRWLPLEKWNNRTPSKHTPVDGVGVADGMVCASDCVCRIATSDVVLSVALGDAVCGRRIVVMDQICKVMESEWG